MNFYRAKTTFVINGTCVRHGQVFCWMGHEDPALPHGVSDDKFFDYYELIDIDEIRGDVGDFEE